MSNVLSVQNVKCGGCASNIKNGLAGMEGVSAVEVDIPTGQVRFEAGDALVPQVKARLAELGYPVKDGKPGIGSRLKLMFGS